MRTGGNMNGFMDLKLKRLIDAGQKAGPAIDATAPYLNGPNTFSQMHALKGRGRCAAAGGLLGRRGRDVVQGLHADHARRAAARRSTKRTSAGLKVTGHLCSVTYAEAADLGIDNLEHGFLAATDFVADKKPDVCPGQGRGQQTDRGARRERRAVQGAREEAGRQAGGADLDADGVRDVHARTPDAAGLEVLTAAAQGAVRAEPTPRTAQNQQSIYAHAVPKGMALERAFAKAGGPLIAGTDPTGGGGVIPGYANQRQLELLVEAGLHAARGDRASAR